MSSHPRNTHIPHKKNVAVRSRRHMSGIGLAVVGLLSLSGVYLIGYGKAASTNPYGFLDSCKVVNGHTIFYGWATDANATSTTQPSATVKAGGTSATVTTPYVYNQTSINNYIDDKHSGDPKPGSYGFQSDMGTLYKGTTYAVSGTALNVGAGSNAALLIYDGTGNGASDGLTFKGNVVPENCKVARPAPTPPPPAPVPTPTPPAPNLTPTPRPTTPATPTSTPPPSPSSAPAPTADANASVTAGTLAASLVVPAGNASKVYIQYGTEATSLDKKTEEKVTNNADTIFSLNGLEPSKTYFYQIIRISDADQRVTSPASTFTTSRFQVVLHFTNRASDVVKDVRTRIQSLKLDEKSSEKGLILINDVKPGSYTVVYSYNNKDQSIPIIVNASGASADEAAKTDTAKLEYYINVDKASVVVKKDSDTKHYSWLTWLSIALVAGGVIILLILLNRRRIARSSSTEGYDLSSYSFMTSEPSEEGIESEQSPQLTDTPDDKNIIHTTPPPLPLPLPPTPPPIPQASKPAGVYVPDDQPAHMGESLKSMVIRSMAEEARKKSGNDHDKRVDDL